MLSLKKSVLSLSSVFGKPQYQNSEIFSTIFSIIVLAFCLVFVIPLTGCRKTSEKSKVAKSNATVKWFDCLNVDEMVWDGIKEYNLDEFSGVTFRWHSEQLEAVTDKGIVPLYNGMPIWSVYFYDLTGESYPDITFLPALANIFETSIDLLIGMDTIRAEETRFSIHKKAVAYQQCGDYDLAETYRDALLIYPNKPGMIFGLASTLALKGNTDEAIELMERGLPLSINEKQKATIRTTLCFLYLKVGMEDKAKQQHRPPSDRP